MMGEMIPRPEHPRPDFMRDTFCNLNGQWQFAFDDENAGLREKWMQPGRKLPMSITVPFAYQTRLSGIGPTDDIHPILWYRRSFTLPDTSARTLIFVEKISQTPSVYPRNGGKIAKSPLK